MMLFQGNSWVFPANVTTDAILPGKYLDRANDEVGQFAMSGIDEEFVKKVQPGDFIVAGPNFGSGSGRETAPIAIKLAGVAAVIAPSFARIFFRNSVNIGLPAVIVKSVDQIKQGDRLAVDLEKRTVTNTSRDETHSILNLTGTSLEILRAGGIVPYTKQRMARAGHAPRKEP
jgi:3-isopropylmalate/(R)-2-methylmalate dehydratase small subunit